MSNPNFNPGYESWCETWLEATVQNVPADERAAIVLREMWAQHRENFFNDPDYQTFDQGNESGVDALYLDVSENEDDSESPVLETHMLRFLTPEAGGEGGKGVAREALRLATTLERGLEGETFDELTNLFDILGDRSGAHILNLVFVSLHPLPLGANESLASACALLEARLATRLNAQVRGELLSLHTLYARDHSDTSVRVSLRVADASSKGELSPRLVLGAVALSDVFDFLRDYEIQRGDLDLLYEKNVRLFLDRKGVVNRGMMNTLKTEPENFGLFNNGLTIVTRQIERCADGSLCLTDPSVVNGCQTTRTIWATLGEEFKKSERDAAQWRAWRERLAQGTVVVKVVRAAPGDGDEGGELFEKITRYTNSQNAVAQKDFVALDQDFRRWKREMALLGVFLEILRGEAKSQLDKQKKPSYEGPRFDKRANAFELLKIYGGAWMNKPGPAWNNNDAFVPTATANSQTAKGRLFRAIVEQDFFGGHDLLAALHLQEAAKRYKFGVGGKASIESRRLTRFLFHRTSIELLRRLLKINGLPQDPATCTKALLLLQDSSAQWKTFLEQCVDTVDSYMDSSNSDSIFNEPVYNGNYNAFFKAENLAESPDLYPHLFAAWNVRETVFKLAVDGPSLAQRVAPLWASLAIPDSPSGT